MVKGDIARALFYMATRYQGDPTNEPALYLTDWLAQIASTTNLMGRLTTLLMWHELDPVDARERRRNDLVFERYQRNRNPFVDRPEWVREAFWPELKFVRNGNEVMLSYPAEYSAAVVEFAFQSLTAPWWPAGGKPALSNNTLVVTFLLPPEPEERGFFRLRLP